MNTCHVPDAQTSGCRCYAQKTLVSRSQGCGRLTGVESGDKNLTSGFSHCNVTRHCSMSIYPHCLPHNAVDAITADNDIPSLYCAIRENHFDSFFTLNDLSDTLLCFDYLLRWQAIKHSLEKGTALHIQVIVSMAKGGISAGARGYEIEQYNWLTALQWSRRNHSESRHAHRADGW